MGNTLLLMCQVLTCCAIREHLTWPLDHCTGSCSRGQGKMVSIFGFPTQNSSVLMIQVNFHIVMSNEVPYCWCCSRRHFCFSPNRMPCQNPSLVDCLNQIYVNWAVLLFLALSWYVCLYMMWWQWSLVGDKWDGQSKHERVATKCVIRNFMATSLVATIIQLRKYVFLVKIHHNLAWIFVPHADGTALGSSKSVCSPLLFSLFFDCSIVIICKHG